MSRLLALLVGIGLVQTPAPGPVAPDAWRGIRVQVAPLAEADASGREKLPPPGIVPRAGLASPTRVPWVHTNGPRFRRPPPGTYVVEAPEGRALVAIAEAAMYDVDMLVGVAPADLPRAGALLEFLRGVPVLALPDVADFGFVDDGTPLAFEGMALFVRRNLLFARVERGDRRYPLTVRLGTKEWPANLAIDPSRLARAVRGALTDDRRSLRIFGSEVVVGRLTGDAGRRRLHLLAYGGRAIEGLRVRLRGDWKTIEARGVGSDRTTVEDAIVQDGWTEFSLPTLAPYAVVDLR
jgi:hypothetical protein